MLDAYQIHDRFIEEDIKGHWEELMGKMIANRTLDVYIRNKKLFLRLDSSVLKQDLLLMKSPLLAKINERAGKELVLDLVVL